MWFVIISEGNKWDHLVSEQQEGEFQKTEASKRGIGDIAMAHS